MLLTVFLSMMGSNYCLKTKFLKRKTKLLGDKLFFGPFLSLATNGFIPVCISIKLNDMKNLDTTWGEHSANMYSDVLKLYIFVWFPIVMLYVVFTGSPKNQDLTFKRRYKFLLSGIRTETKL